MLTEASSRTNWKREAQNMFGALVEPSIKALNRRHFFRNTAIERALKERSVLPDDLTLSQLEMTVGICNNLAEPWAL